MCLLNCFPVFVGDVLYSLCYNNCKFGNYFYTVEFLGCFAL